MIAIIDYGMGNLRSVEKGLAKVGHAARITADPEEVRPAAAVVLPGVGAFGDAMRNLEASGLIPAIRDAVDAGKPFLGICLGLQLLFEESEESPGVRGLGLLPGRVERFRHDLKVPHIGWNQLHLRRRAPVLGGVPEDAFAYFVHSYYVAPAEDDVVATTTDYGYEFVSGVWRDNVCAFQFHPEKSQAVGLRILENFGRLAGGKGNWETGKLGN
jgi:glutamine amidotransferase